MHVQLLKRAPSELLGGLKSDGLNGKGYGVAALLARTFNNALVSSDNIDNALLYIRELALYLNNDADNAEAAFLLLNAVFAKAGNSMSLDMRKKLQEDRAVLHKNWKMGELETHAGDLAACENILDELIVYANDNDKGTFRNLKSEIQRKRTFKKIKWGFYAVIAAIIGYSILADEFNRPSRSYSSRVSSPSSSESAVNTSSAGLNRETRPPVGTSQVLSRDQVRYCVFQGKRLDYMRPSIKSNRQVDRLNELIDDWNARCSSYRYRDSVLSAVQSEAGKNSAQLKDEARRIVASW